MKCEKELALLRETIRNERKDKRITLEELAEMLEVSGVGEHKFEKYGARFLQRIAEHV